MSRKSPAVSIIIPSMYLWRPKSIRYVYKKSYSLPQVLEDIRKNVQIDHEVIVICNGQKDKKLIEFVQSSPLVDKYCINSVNAGVSRAWNMGANLAEGQALCFVNDDVEIGEGAIETLYKVLSSDENIGEVGPKGAKWSGAKHDRWVGAESIEEADAISGFLFMIKITDFWEVGGFDIAYTPAGFEEIDMSFKLRKMGKKCLVIPNLDVCHYSIHGVSSTVQDISYFSSKINTKDLYEKNQKIFISKWL